MKRRLLLPSPVLRRMAAAARSLGLKPRASEFVRWVIERINAGEPLEFPAPMAKVRRQWSVMRLPLEVREVAVALAMARGESMAGVVREVLEGVDAEVLRRANSWALGKLVGEERVGRVERRYWVVRASREWLERLYVLCERLRSRPMQLVVAGLVCRALDAGIEPSVGVARVLGRRWSISSAAVVDIDFDEFVDPRPALLMAAYMWARGHGWEVGESEERFVSALAAYYAPDWAQELVKSFTKN